MSIFPLLSSVCQSKFVGNNKVFNSDVFSCNNLSRSSLSIFISFPLCSDSRRLSYKNFNDYDTLSESIFVLKEQCEKEILYLEDKKYEITEKLRKKNFIKALMAYAVYSATQYGVANKLQLKILEFKKLIIFTESFVNNSLVTEVNEINPKFVIFFYYLTKIVSLNLVIDKGYLSRKNVLRNLFFLFVFGFERLKFFNFINKTTLFFNLPTSKRRKKRKSNKVSSSRFVYYGVVPLLFYSPFKVSFFINNNSRFKNFLVMRSRFATNYSLIKSTAQKIALRNKTFLFNALLKLKLTFNLIKLKSNFDLMRVSAIIPCRSIDLLASSAFCNSFSIKRKRSRIFSLKKRLRFSFLRPTIKSSFKKQFDHYFFSLIRVFYLDRKFLLKRKRKKHNFKMKSRILFIIKALFRSGRFFFVDSYFKLLCYYYFIQKLEGIFFSGRIFRFKIFENLHEYNNVLFKIFKKIKKQRLIRLINNQNAFNSKKSSFKTVLLINSADPTVIYTNLSNAKKETNKSFTKAMTNIGLRFYKRKIFSKLKGASLFFNIFFSIPNCTLNLRSLRFRFLLFFLRTAMKARMFFSLNSFLFSKYVRFLFFRLNLDNSNKKAIAGLASTLGQFFLTNFFFLNNFFCSFRRKILFNFFEKAKKRSSKSFFGYFNLLFPLLNSKLISNSTQSLIVKKKFYSRSFIKQFSALFYSFFNKPESLVSISNIKFDEKFVDGFASKYFYSFLLPKRPIKKYRLIFLARLEVAKKRVLNLLLRSKKQKRKVKIIFHSSMRIRRKNVYRSLKRKANFFFRLLKIFMPSLKLAGRFSVFFVYRKKSKKLPMLLDYYKKSFYIPKTFLRKCLDQHNNLFTRLSNIYLSKGGKLTILGPTLLAAEKVLNFLNTTTVSYVFFMKWKIFVAGSFFSSSIPVQVSEYSFKCLFTWLSMVKLKYLLPLLSQISPSFFTAFGSPFFDYFILVRFFILFKLESFFSKLNFRFINVLLEAFLVSKFLAYGKFVFLFLFYLPVYKSRPEFTSGILNLTLKTNLIFKRNYSSSNSLFDGVLISNINKRNRLPRKIGKKIYYFASGIFFSIKKHEFLKLRPNLSGTDNDYFFSFFDYCVFYKLFSNNLRFEFKINSLTKSLKFFLTLDYLPSWFGYFFLRNSISLGGISSFFSRFNNNFINYSAPFSIGFFSFLVFFFRKYRFFIYQVQKRKSRSRGRRCNKWFTFLRIFYFKYFTKLSFKKLKKLRRQSRTRVVLGFSANSFNKSFLFNIFFDFIQIRFKELVSICYSLFNSFNFSPSIFLSDCFRKYFDFFILRQIFFIFLRSVTLKFQSLFPNESKNQMVIQLYRGLFGKHVKFYFLLLVKAVSIRNLDYLNYLSRCRKVCEKFYSKFIFMAFRNMRYRSNSRNFIFSLFKSLKKFPFSVSNKGVGSGHRNFSLLFSEKSMSNNSFFPTSKFVSFKSLESKAIFPIFSLSRSSQFGPLFLKFLSNVVYLKLLKFVYDISNKCVCLDNLRQYRGNIVFFSSYFYLFSTNIYTLVICFNMFRNKLSVLKKNMIGMVLNRVGALFIFFGFYNLRKIFSDVSINQSYFVLVKQLYIYLLLYLKKFIFWFSILPIRSLLIFPKKFKGRGILPVYSFKYFLLKYFLLKGRFKFFLHFRRVFFRNGLFQKFYFEKFKFFRVIKLKVRRYTLSVVKKKARLFDSYLRKRKVILGRIILNRKHLTQKKAFFLDVFFSVKFLKFSGFKNFMACCTFFSSYLGLPNKLKRRFLKVYLFFFGLRMSFLKSFFLKFFLAGLYLRYRLQMLNRYLFFRIIFLKTFKLYPRFYFVISKSRNNIFLTIRSLQGRLIYKCTPGLLKFKGSDKLSNFALYETCLYFFDIFIKLCQEVTLRRKFGYFFYNMRTRRKKSEERVRKKNLGDYSRTDNKDSFQDPLLRVQRFFLITKGISPYLVRIFLKAMRRRKVSKYMAGTLEYPFIAFTNSKVRKVRRI